MSRYTGPRLRVMRALGVQLPGLARRSIERRPYPPGQHGAARKRRSEYAIRLQEKQKLRLNYGLGERQLRRLVREARAASGSTGKKLLELLERRLDNVVFRAGFAPTIPAARQLVNHGHVTVNGRRVDIASYRVAAGDLISLRERSRSLRLVEEGGYVAETLPASWLSIDRAARRATVLELPDERSVPFPIHVQLVVELYAQRI